MNILLQVSDLSVRYGQLEAVHAVSLQIAAGQIVSVIGPNGAGKSTLLNALAGALPASGQMQGRVCYHPQGVLHEAPRHEDGSEIGRMRETGTPASAPGDAIPATPAFPQEGASLQKGVDILRWTIEQRVAAGICLVPEKRELFGTMTVEDNLLLGAWPALQRPALAGGPLAKKHFLARRPHGLRGTGLPPIAPAQGTDAALDTSPTSMPRAGAGLRRAQLPQALAEVHRLFPRLWERRRQLAHTLSGGERQMLAMGRALMGSPRLLMLDEPSLGLAPRIVQDIFRTLRTLREGGCAILLVEQNARAALGISDYGYVLEAGSCVLAGPAPLLVQDPRMIGSYLGSTREKTA